MDWLSLSCDYSHVAVLVDLIGPALKTLFELLVLGV